MALSKITKQSYERFFVRGSILNVQEDGTETVDLNSSIVRAEDKDGNLVSSAVLDQATKALDSDPKGSYTNNAVKIRFQNGRESLSPYIVTFRMPTSKGNRWEVDVKVVIKEQGTTETTTTTTTTT